MSKFLVVDDDPVSGQMLREILSPYGQCDVVLGGKEAIDAVRNSMANDSPYDLVCLDILMPDIGGHDVLREIRRMEAEEGVAGSTNVKVIMTTALRDSKHCLQAFREGCESYITKPVKATEMLQQMNALGVLTRESFDRARSGH
ncbi:MAG: response regulator [Pirellulaceae bacterium]|nr:response regulator [Pirellulaceae bacterium]